MFSKSKKHKNKAPLISVRSVPSIISADLQIFGNLKSAGEVQIDGEVSGDIHSKVLLVGESAVIRGEIIAETVRVHGHINGQIKAKYVNLAKTANVVGDILHENLSIQEGAFLEGHITHMSDQDIKAMDRRDVAVNVEPHGQSTHGQSPHGQSKDQSKTLTPQNRQAQSAKPAEERVNLVVKVGGTKTTGVSTPQPAASAHGSNIHKDTPKAVSGS